MYKFFRQSPLIKYICTQLHSTLHTPLKSTISKYYYICIAKIYCMKKTYSGEPTILDFISYETLPKEPISSSVA